ncbi:MAG: SH3 domain-containing protein [Opitutaceae bacterium]|nr:SH3 domain-containing protein [Opitutaceae bacterium]
MMNKILFTLSVLAGAAGLSAAPLAHTAAVHTRPDPAAPTITFLKAGSSPTLVSDPLGATPAGWVAVRLAGPFEVYVENKAIGKSLEVRPGTAFHLQPKADATVISQMEAGDKATITGLHGRWTQIQLEKDIVGYVRVSGGASLAPSAPVLTDVPRSPPPAVPAPVVRSDTVRPAPAAIARSDGGSGVLPRLFQGRFVSSKRPFAPRRPYDWQLNDDAGVRYAYLDISKLLLTEQIEKYTDRVVVVFGTPKPMPDGRDIVIEIESLQLK